MYSGASVPSSRAEAAPAAGAGAAAGAGSTVAAAPDAAFAPSACWRSYIERGSGEPDSAWLTAGNAASASDAQAVIFIRQS